MRPLGPSSAGTACLRAPPAGRKIPKPAFGQPVNSATRGDLMNVDTRALHSEASAMWRPDECRHLATAIATELTAQKLRGNALFKARDFAGAASAYTAALHDAVTNLCARFATGDTATSAPSAGTSDGGTKISATGVTAELIGVWKQITCFCEQVTMWPRAPPTHPLQIRAATHWH